MKKKIFIIALVLIIASCRSDNHLYSVTISGNIQTKNLSKIDFKYFVDNPITNEYRFYSTEVNEAGVFKINIPINRMTFGQMIIENEEYHLCLIPGDEIQITGIAEGIQFDGKGAEKNNFIQKETKKEFWNNYYNEFYKAEMSLDECFDAGLKVVENCQNFIDTYPQKDQIELEYFNYYKMLSTFFFEQLIINYPEVYSQKNYILLDSLQIPENYKQLDSFKYLIKDERTSSEYYLTWLDSYLEKQFFKSMSLGRFIEENSLLLDSLSGKTREYMLARKIIDGLERRKYDSILINIFNQTAYDDLSIATINEAVNRYEEKENLIGKPLCPEFSETIIEDTSNIQLNFGELLERYKGKVVYLDIWSLKCGPCIGEMPLARELEKRLDKYPIEFVYITQDPPNKNLWQQVFEKSMTKNNHYRMVEHEWGSSKMLRFLKINWVPCHMIFDTNGNLIDFLAQSPSSQELDNLLIGLANNNYAP